MFLELEENTQTKVAETSLPKAEHSNPVAKQPEVSEVKAESPKTDPRDVYQLTKAMKQELLNKVEEIGVYLPNNTLDELIDCLGGPSKVSFSSKYREHS